jgi:HEAT repeat protein
MRKFTAAVIGGAALAALALGGAACRRSAEDKVPRLIEQLGSADQTQSGQAARELIEIGEPAVPALAAALSRPDARLRAAAATTIWGLGTRARAAAPALASALSDADPNVRISVAMALGNMEGEAAPAVPALIQALKDDDGNVRLWAVKALGAIGKPARAAVPALRDAARVDSTRSAADEALRRIQAP